MARTVRGTATADRETPSENIEATEAPETPEAPEAFDWNADIESETFADPLPADVEIPVGIRNLIVKALDEGPQVVVYQEWPEAKAKEFEKLVRAAKGPFVLTYVRVDKVLRTGKKAFRVSVSRQPRKNAKGTAPETATPETSE